MSNLLDIHDSFLQLWHGEHRVSSPGFALLQGTDYQFGSAALAAAKLHPRAVNNRYWWQLSTAPLAPPMGPARHHADLVHAHLKQLHAEASQPQTMALAVPASMTREQLALLLGIVDQCAFAATGLINRSVLLATAYPGAQRVLHLELQLHQAVIVELQVEGTLLRYQRHSALPGCGQLQLRERLLEAIANAFISQTRFDPRQQATNEQSLNKQLPALLQTLRQQEEANIVIADREARISKQSLQQAGERLQRSIAATIGSLNSGDQILLDPAAVLLPGLQQSLPKSIATNNGDLLRALSALDGQWQSEDEQPHYLSALAAPITAVSNTAAPVAKRELSIATHLLRGSIARPIGSGATLDEHLQLHWSKTGCDLRGELQGVQVNGDKYRSGQALHCGDVISRADTELVQLIRVEP